MAKLHCFGAEIEASTSTTSPDGSLVGTTTRDTVTFRSGAASFKCDSTGANATAFTSIIPTWTLAVSRTYFIRAYYNTSATPTGNATIMGSAGASTTVRVRINTSGQAELWINNAKQGSASTAINDGSWHRVELKWTTDAASSTTVVAAELLVDGTSIATFSGSVGGAAMSHNYGWVDAPGASKVINVDDVSINDSTGSVNNSYPGDGRVVLLKPISDNAVGSGWTNSGGTGTSLFDSVDNTPPTGIADTTSNNGHQIRNASSNSASYDANLGAYSTAVGSGGGGLAAGDTVNAVIPWIATAAPVSTAAKTGSVGIASNPVIANVALTANSGQFWSGTAAGTYPTGWKWSAGTVTETPTVTLGTSPVMRVTITGGTATRIAMACSMFLYVDYTPASAVTTLLAQPAFYAGGSLMSKALEPPQRIAQTWRNRRRSGLLVPDLWIPAPA